MIETKGLSRAFGDHLVVNQLDLFVEKGEVLGFLGPNGAGKTTTVRMLCSLISPTAGSAKVNGHDVVGDPMAVRRSVGILTETPGLYERLSAKKNLEIFAKLYDVPDVEGQVRKYLELLGLWDRAKDPAGSFSKGMRQKLAIARSLLHEPPVLFLDEPTSALDPEASRIVREFILDLKGQGRTIFLCTHNLDEADRLCDRIAVFKQSLVALDTADQLRKVLYGHQVVFHLAPAESGAPDAAVVAALRDHEGVEEVLVQGDKLLARIDKPDARNPSIIRALVNAGAELQYVGERHHSLENVYLDLLGDDA